LQEELAHTYGKSILEIGPGMGRTAYYARMARLRDYTTVDLPIGIVAQACFLGAALGPDALWLHGEDTKMGAGRIRLYCSSALPKINKTFGIVLNVDSITEMESGAALIFFRWIASHCETFLSINHEANAVLVAQITPDFFPQAYRHRNSYWMREGYVEEVFKHRPSLRTMLSR
jgi:putative sugar O-methyltransferase